MHIYLYSFFELRGFSRTLQIMTDKVEKPEVQTTLPRDKNATFLWFENQNYLSIYTSIDVDVDVTVDVEID